MHLTEQELAKLLRSNPDIHLQDVGKVQQALPPKQLSPKSQLEEKFLVLWMHLGGPALEREYRFGETMHRADFAHLPTRILIELEGGTWSKTKKSRHSTPSGYRDDCRKYNLATMQGWRVLRLTADMVTVPYLETLIHYFEREIYVVTRPDED